jgi:two-component system, NarL family, sensor histidine kinase DesK
MSMDGARPADRARPDTPAGVTGLRRPRTRRVFIAITLFFTIWPFVAVLQSRPQPVALALLLAGWAIFGLVLLGLFRVRPFERGEDSRLLPVAVVALAAIGVVAQVAFGIGEAVALFYYAGVSAATLTPESRSLAAIGSVAVAAGVSVAVAAGDPAAGVPVGITVGTISMTLSALSALGRTNRELHAARLELAEVAVAEERVRIARDLHDTLGHSLSLIALKSELARRLLPDDPGRAAQEIGDVEQAARDALASVRVTVGGYRQPTLAMELAGAREALRAAGIAGTVEPAPEGLPREVDALLGWAVREGITNVLRHSDARSATVRVIADEARRGVEIVDDGRGSRNGGSDGGGQADGGFGLAGLRERAGRLGGGVEAGLLADRGFRLLVTVPVEPAP